MNKDILIKSVALAFLSLSTQLSIAATTSTEPATEKCYGIVKAGMNDCSTATASCAGSATKDKQKDAFILLAKGTCEKIVGASLKPLDK